MDDHSKLPQRLREDRRTSDHASDDLDAIAAATALTEMHAPGASRHPETLASVAKYTTTDSRYKFKALATGGTNYVWVTTDKFKDNVYADTAWADYKGQLVVKVSRDDNPRLFNKLSGPERAVRVYNEIHKGHNHPPAKLYRTEKGMGWISPYFSDSVQASDKEISHAQILQYINTGRITYDAATTGNYLKVNLDYSEKASCPIDDDEDNELVQIEREGEALAVELVDVDVAVRTTGSPPPKLEEITHGSNTAGNKGLEEVKIERYESDAMRITKADIEELSDIYLETGYWKDLTLQVTLPMTLNITQNLIYLDGEYEAKPGLSRIIPKSSLTYELVSALTPLREAHYRINEELAGALINLINAKLPLKASDLRTLAAALSFKTTDLQKPARAAPPPSTLASVATSISGERLTEDDEDFIDDDLSHPRPK